MYAKAAVVLIVALVGVASAAHSKCQIQSEVPVLANPEFSAYVQFNGTNSYLPLNYKGHSTGSDHPIRGVSRGKGSIKTDCAEIQTTFVSNEQYHQLIYTMQSMDFTVGETKQRCVLGPVAVEKSGVKRYNCINADEQVIATLFVERLNLTAQTICQMTPTKLCKFTWVEKEQN